MAEAPNAEGTSPPGPRNDGRAVDLRVRHRNRAPDESPAANVESGDATDLDLSLPHERDESSAGVSNSTPSPEIRRAYRDATSGQVDTDRRGDAAEIFDRAHVAGGPRGHDLTRGRANADGGADPEGGRDE